MKEEGYGFIYITKEDYDSAKRLETQLSHKISFYDCIHIIVCKRLNLVLITRDKDLIKVSREHIKVKRPEELIH